MLVHFSEVMNDAFSTRSDLTGLEFTITGLLKAAWSSILKWMLLCCSAKGVTQFESMTFVNFIHVLEAASSLKVPLLCEQLRFRIEKQFEKQLHIERVKEIYKYLPPNHPFRRRAVEHICGKIRGEGLRGWHHYIQFKQENTEYEADVDACLAHLSAQDREVRQAEWKAAMKEEEKKVRKEKRAFGLAKKREFLQYRAEQEKAGPGNYRKYADWQRDMQLARGETPESFVEKHDTVKARVGQNAGGGKKWLHMPLEAVMRGGCFDLPNTSAVKKNGVSPEDAGPDTEADITAKLNDATLKSIEEVSGSEEKAPASSIILAQAAGEGSFKDSSSSRRTSTTRGPSTRETSAEECSQAPHPHRAKSQCPQAEQRFQRPQEEQREG